MKDDIDKFFDQHREEYNRHSPPRGHEDRFRQKLNRRNGNRKQRTIGWLPMAWAASILLAVMAGGYLFSNQNTLGNQDFVKTTRHYEGLVEEERSVLVSMNQNDAGKWYADVESQLDELQKNQKQLQKDYRRSGRDPRILQVMIQNYQMQIDLLTDIQTKIQTHEKQKSNDYQEI